MRRFAQTLFVAFVVFVVWRAFALVRSGMKYGEAAVSAIMFPIAFAFQLASIAISPSQWLNLFRVTWNFLTELLKSPTDFDDNDLKFLIWTEQVEKISNGTYKATQRTNFDLSDTENNNDNAEHAENPATNPWATEPINGEPSSNILSR
jgi:hypothetical protein